MKKETKNNKDEALDKGVQEIAEGTEKVVAAKALGDISRDLEAAGVSDLTRAGDLEVVAERLAALSEVVESAGEALQSSG